MNFCHCSFKLECGIFQLYAEAEPVEGDEEGVEEGRGVDLVTSTRVFKLPVNLFLSEQIVNISFPKLLIF